LTGKFKSCTEFIQTDDFRDVPEESVVVELGLPDFVVKFSTIVKEEFSTYSDDKLFKELSSMLRKFKHNGIFQYEIKNIRIAEHEVYRAKIYSETQDVLSSYSCDKETSRHNLLTAFVESFGISRVISQN